MMNMKKALSYIGVNRGMGRKENLKRMEWLMDQLDHPEKQLKFIHIAGTNGKGSTAAFLFSILGEAGLRVGLFTSPHLEIINERIRVSDQLISDQDLQKYTEKVAYFVDQFESQNPDERFFAFEILTALALCYFVDQRVDIVILEAGVGGRLDATNIISNAEVSIITSVGKDHLSTLGNTVEAIASEKVGILKKGSELIVGPVTENIAAIISNHARAVGGEVTFIDRRLIEVLKVRPEFQNFIYEDSGPYVIQLQGSHQIDNACVAVKATEVLIRKGWSISTEQLARGLAKALWPGRFEKINDHPLLYLDGAHNLPAVKKLMTTIVEHFPNEKITFVIGMMRDKDYRAMIEYSLPLAQKYLVVSPDQERGFDTEAVAQWLCSEKGISARALSNVQAIKRYVIEKADSEEIIIQFGSLYLVGALREIFVDVS